MKKKFSSAKTYLADFSVAFLIVMFGFFILPGVFTAGNFIVQNSVDGNIFVVNGDSGWTGIGTSFPKSMLTVQGALSLAKSIAPGASSGYGLIYVKNDGNVYFKDENGTETPLLGGGSSAVWKTSGSSAYYTTGNVGIGTTGPDHQFHLLQRSGEKNILKISGTTGRNIFRAWQDIGSSNFYQLTTDVENIVIGSVPGDPNWPAKRFALVPKNANSNGITIYALSGQTGNLFEIGGTGSNNGNLFVVKGTGNVGIGTTSPAYKLDVSGAVNATTYYGDGSNLTGISAGQWSDAGTYIYANNASNIVVTDTNKVGIGTTTPTAKLDVFDGNVSFNSGQFFFNRDTNRVGIGTTNPVQKLDVRGNTYISGSLSIGWQRVSRYCGYAPSCTVYCPSGKRVLGGGCYGTHLYTIPERWLNYPNSDTSWHCRNNRDVYDYITAYAICARVAP